MQNPPFRGNLYRSSADLDAWLGTRVEAVVEPDLPLVDTHHHLWKDERGDYEIGALAADAHGNNLVATVYVECGTGYEASVDYSVSDATLVDDFLRPTAETDYVRMAGEAAAADPIGGCRGIVGFANLLLGKRAAAVLEAQIDAGGGRFRGIRQASGWDAAVGAAAYRNPPPGLLLDDRFLEGFSTLKPLGLTYDAWVFFTQIPDVTALADLYPDTTVILNHFGGLIGIGPYAPRQAEVFKLWRTYVRTLARRPNAILKMGGLGMIASGSLSHLDEYPPTSEELAVRWRPFIETAVEAFGPDRCMIGTNFPVDRQTSSYTSLWNTYKLCTRQYNAQERGDILAGTAKRIYRL